MIKDIISVLIVVMTLENSFLFRFIYSNLGDCGKCHFGISPIFPPYIHAILDIYKVAR